MARGILGGLFGGSDDSSVMPGLLDQAGYMDPAEYDRRRQGDAMQGLWAGLLQGSGPSLEPRNFFSALGGGLAASQKSANEFDESQLRRAQGVAAFQKSALERQKLKLATDIYGEVLPKSGSTGAPAAAPDAGGGGGGTTGTGNLSDPRGLVPYIRAEAARLNIDPDVAVRVAGSEGLGTFLGDGGKSGGAFQLYTGGGVGNLFQRDTGLDPLDPANEKATITYALQHAAKNGWGDWNGAKKLGITGYTGIGKPGEPSAANVTDLSAVPDFTGAMMGRQGASYAPATPPPMPGAVVAGAPGPAPAPGATAAGQNTMPMPDNLNQLKTQQQQNAAVLAARGIPLFQPGTRFNSRGAAISPDLSRTLPGQQSGPPNISPAIIPPNFATPRPSLSGGSGGSTEPSPLPPDAGEIGSGGEAPVPGGITYGSGVLGRAAAAAAAGAPAAAAPAPGGTLPGAAAAPTLALPAPPELPPLPALAMPQPLPPPPAAAALRPLEATGAAPAVQLSPEQAARTQRAQRLSLSLDLIGVTVPKFIADEAGIDVAARSAAAQEAAKQPFAVQLKRLDAETAAAQKRWDAADADQKATLAAERGLTVKQLDAQYANLHEQYKQALAAFLAGPNAAAVAAAQLGPKKEELEFGATQRIREAWDSPKDYKIQDPLNPLQERTVTMTPREAARIGLGPPPPSDAGVGPAPSPPGAAAATPAPAPGATQPPRGLVTGLSELGKQVMGPLYEAKGLQIKKIYADAEAARDREADLDRLESLSPHISAGGAFAPYQQAFNRVMYGLTGSRANEVSSYENYSQVQGDMVRKALRASDPNPTAKQQDQLYDTFPTPSTSDEGRKEGLGYMRAIVDYHRYRAAELSKYMARPGANPLNFDDQFTMTAIPFAFLRMSQATQQQYMRDLAAKDLTAARQVRAQVQEIEANRQRGQ